jgi:hypothetical protein
MLRRFIIAAAIFVGIIVPAAFAVALLVARATPAAPAETPIHQAVAARCG